MNFVDTNAKLLAAFIFEKQPLAQDISMLQKKKKKATEFDFLRCGLKKKKHVVTVS